MCCFISYCLVCVASYRNDKASFRLGGDQKLLFERIGFRAVLFVHDYKKLFAIIQSLTFNETGEIINLSIAMVKTIHWTINVVNNE